MWNYLSKRLEGVARLVVCELITCTLFMLKEQITQRHLIGWRVIITVELENESWECDLSFHTIIKDLSVYLVIVFDRRGYGNKIFSFNTYVFDILRCSKYFVTYIFPLKFVDKLFFSNQYSLFILRLTY